MHVPTPTRLRPVLVAALLGIITGVAGVAAQGQTTTETKVSKNWSPPAEKIYAQALCDAIMKAHAELLSVTLHGSPPGYSGIYTMFAGSYPERIGNPDDPDDVDVITKGITIVDPRWHRTRDPVPKFVVQLPLRDAAGENIGLIVLAYKVPAPVGDGATEVEFFRRAARLRDALKPRIPSFAALFKPAGAQSARSD